MMKLGSQTGSLVNHIYSRTAGVEPEVGMGATICMWSDREAATIVEVGKNYLVTQVDEAVRVDNNGISESQTYVFTPNPNSYKQYWKKNKDGLYKMAHHNENGRLVMSGASTHLHIGERAKFYDFSF